MPDPCECGKPAPYDGGKEGTCECCSTCEPAQPKPPSTSRCNDCGVKVNGLDNYTIYGPDLGRSTRDYCRRCYSKVKFGKVAKDSSSEGDPS